MAMPWENDPIVGGGNVATMPWEGDPIIETQPQETTLAGRIGSQISEISQEYATAKEKSGGGFLGPLNAVIGTGVRAAGDIAGEVGETVWATIPKEAQDVIASAVGKVTKSAIETPGIKQAMEIYDKLPDSVKYNLGTSALIGGSMVGGGAGAKMVGKVVPKITAEIKSMEEVAKLDKTIKTGIQKGIKPTVLGKQTTQRVEQFYDKANDAVKTIAENKNLINLTDEAGEIISHPRSATEMAQAIDKTKKVIYKQYHDMAIAAGDKGAQFNLMPVADKLAEISDPKNIKVPPEVRKYAENLYDELEELDGAAPEVVEARIADLNNSLAGYYEGRVNKAKAQVDASVANLMREELDNNISHATGEGYQELKNKYGALKGIEREVNKRAIVNARKNAKGLIDFTDIFTGGELVGGILTMNPALIAKSVAGRGIKEFYKKLNNPDRYIEKMFKEAYGINEIPNPSNTKRAISKTGAAAIGGSVLPEIQENIFSNLKSKYEESR